MFPQNNEHNNSCILMDISVDYVIDLILLKIHESWSVMLKSSDN